jgi:CheY-like chemotaxis protein/DNA-directed RNA polymerase specialized sigma24 family protein
MTRLETLAPHLPFVRRYARALTGDQATGDSYVRACLEAIRESDDVLSDDLPPRVAFYRAFEAIWRSSGALLEPREIAGDAQPAGWASPSERLMRIAPRSRQAFLLTSVEGFTDEEAAVVLSTTTDEVEDLIAEAQADIDAELATDVLIIEDEPIIAADIAALVTELGHRVLHVAATRADATAAAKRDKPGLILADVQLADGSSGIDATIEILANADAPAIFITGFPERLLTGKGFEPTFLITKPFDAAHVKAAIGQALFFHPRRQDTAGDRVAS